MRNQKIVALVLVAMLSVFALAGCGTASNGGSAASKDAGGDASYSIGMIQLLEHPALDAASEGFQDAVKEALGEENVKFDFQNAQGEQANCATIASGFVTNKVDLIFANATPALQATAQATSDIPIVGTSITDYASALDIADWTGATGSNVTGTSDLAPLDQQAAMIKELFPEVKQVGILYCSAEANSVYQVENIGAELDKLGVAHKAYAAADSNEVQSVTTSAIAECDVLYIPTDNTMASNTEIINNIAAPANIPIVAGEEGICKACGLATLSISYYDLGYAAGEIAADILQNGTDPGTVEIAYAKNVVKEYNPEIAKALNITLPDDYVALELDAE
ncbi:MAG: ABC transporter substrate-binding protein [Firmicutes bacterium]|nr:ABC transporter substrate-binding protein [Bacillota bacterium]